MPTFVTTVAEAFEHAGVDLEALGLAWVRVSPAVALIPAFGLRALPAPARAALGLAFAAAIFPAVHADAGHAALPWPALACLELVRGLPVAISAAVPLWAATMVGGVADALRGANDPVSVATVEGSPTALGALFSLLACTLFFATGGPARVVEAMALGSFDPAHPVLTAVHDLSGGVTLAVTLASPLLVASVVLELAAALVARAASPSQVHALIAPIRALGILAVVGLVLDRIVTPLAEAIARAPAQSGMR